MPMPAGDTSYSTSMPTKWMTSLRKEQGTPAADAARRVRLPSERPSEALQLAATIVRDAATTAAIGLEGNTQVACVYRRAA